MKRLLLFILLAAAWTQPVVGQIFYETRWTTGNVKYTGLLIYYDDNDAVMRIKYTINNKFKVAEFKCFGEHFGEDEYSGYILDGQDAIVVYGDDGNGYSADNFIFINTNGTYASPYQIDDNGLEKSNISDYMSEVEYWNEISTDKFTETYVNSFFEKSEPLYKTLLSYNIQNNEGGGSEKNYRISALSTSSEEWAVVMSKGTGYTNQTWKTSNTFPTDWVKEKWESDFYITSLAHKYNEWVVVMSKGTPHTTQSFNRKSIYPNEWIKEKWDQGYYITSLSYGEGEWAVVMSKGTGYTTQSWNRNSAYPTEWIKEKWDQGYHISSLAYGGGEWVVVMSKGTGYSTQSWKKNSTYPTEWIKEKWNENYDITSVTHGNGEWVVTMSKGTVFTTQAWKTNNSFPKDWIKEKWDVQTTTVQNQPDIVENATLHLIMVSNTIISDIGTSCRADMRNTVNEFEIICEELDITFSKTTIHDKQFSKQAVMTAINNLTPGSNDIIVFVYSGHGFRWSDQSSQYPTLDLRYSNYQPLSDNNTINLANIYNTLISKGSRLNIIIGDCCNSNIGVSNRAGEASLSSRKQSQGRVDKLRKLFLQSKGNVIAAAAKPNETSCGNSNDGGYFLNSFFASISKETSQLDGNNPNWETIITRAINTANYKTQNLRGCDPQSGIYFSTVK